MKPVAVLTELDVRGGHKSTYLDSCWHTVSFERGYAGDNIKVPRCPWALPLKDYDDTLFCIQRVFPEFLFVLEFPRLSSGNVRFVLNGADFSGLVAKGKRIPLMDGDVFCYSRGPATSRGSAWSHCEMKVDPKMERLYEKDPTLRTPDIGPFWFKFHVKPEKKLSSSLSKFQSKYLLELPEEVLRHIFSFMSPVELMFNVAPLCRRLFNLVSGGVGMTSFCVDQGMAGELRAMKVSPRACWQLAQVAGVGSVTSLTLDIDRCSNVEAVFKGLVDYYGRRLSPKQLNDVSLIGGKSLWTSKDRRFGETARASLASSLDSLLSLGQVTSLRLHSFAVVNRLGGGPYQSVTKLELMSLDRETAEDYIERRVVEIFPNLTQFLVPEAVFLQDFRKFFELGKEGPEVSVWVRITAQG